MKNLATFLAIAALIGCNSAGPGAGGQAKQPTHAPVEFLVTTAASDFHNQRPPHPARFREVHIGHVVAPNGTTRYMLCGEYLPASEDDTAEWTPFVTIETDPYEQWLGAQARGYCEQPSIVWLEGDYSSMLQTRFDSQR